jgi:hypothetical protein
LWSQIKQWAWAYSWNALIQEWTSCYIIFSDITCCLPFQAVAHLCPAIHN